MRRVRPFPFDRLDRIAHAQVDACRALLAQLPLPAPDLGAVEALLGGPLGIRLLDAYVFPSRELLFRLPGPPVPLLARLSAAGGREALLVLDPLLAGRLARRALGLDLEGPGPPTAHLGAGEQRALASLLAPLCEPVGARLEGFVLDDAEIAPLFPDPLVMALDARVTSPAGDGWARLLAPERLRLRATPVRAVTDVARHHSRLHAAVVSLVVEIGRTRLSRGELASMAPGDVVVFDRFGPRPPFGGPVTLRLGRGAIGAHLDGEGITVVKGFQLWFEQTEAPAMERDDGDAGEATGGDALLRELPVDVVCELGRVTLTGRELARAAPGRGAAGGPPARRSHRSHRRRPGGGAR